MVNERLTNLGPQKSADTKVEVVVDYFVHTEPKVESSNPAYAIQALHEVIRKEKTLTSRLADHLKPSYGPNMPPRCPHIPRKKNASQISRRS